MEMSAAPQATSSWILRQDARHEDAGPHAVNSHVYGRRRREPTCSGLLITIAKVRHHTKHDQRVNTWDSEA